MAQATEFSPTSVDQSTLVDTLVADLNSDDGLVRRRARRELEDLGSLAVPALIRALSNSHDHVRWESAKALCDVHDAGAAPALVQRLDDENFSIRWLAAEALINIGTDSIAPLLHALVIEPGSVWLRQGAHHILSALVKEGPADVIKPVLRALEDVEPDIAVPGAAEAALKQLSAAH